MSKLLNIWNGLSALQKRLVTAVALAPIALAVIVCGGVIFYLLCIVVALLAYREWLPMVQTEWKKHLEYTAYATLVATLALAPWTNFSTALIVCVLGTLIVCVQAHMYIDSGKKEAPPWICGGLLYVAIPIFCLIWLRSRGEALVPGMAWAPLMMIILCVWTTDSCAYFAGRAFGGLKLAPQISPNKTWSGLMGGVLGSAVMMGALAYIWEFRVWPLFMLMGAVLAVTAQVGDLFESFVKRRAGVKDSGTLIPGHGGILDRIDGLMTAVPLFTLFVWVLGLR